MRLIGGNSLNNLLLVLIIVTHSSSLLRISYVLMIPYCGGTDREKNLGLPNVCGNGQEAREWVGDT